MASLFLNLKFKCSGLVRDITSAKQLSKVPFVSVLEGIEVGREQC